MTSVDIVIIGPLLNNDIVMAESLSYEGFDCAVVRPSEIGAPDIDTLPAPLEYFSPDRILISSSSLEFYRISQTAKCVITYSGAISSYLRYLWLLLPILPFPPIINVPTGSDITELAVEKSLPGALYRQVLRRAAFTVVPAYPIAIKVLKKSRLRNYIFFKYPYLLPKQTNSPPVTEERIVYLHVSHLDWGETDNKPGRNSTKGNDRFIKAFAAAAHEGAPIRCKILDRGPDRLAARKLIEDLDATELFEWLEPVPQRELGKLFVEADVVVDQFDVGGLGAISMEAMAQGVPVMTYLEPDCVPLVYDDDPPILNCHSESDINACILANQDREKLSALGAKAERWVRRNHDTGHDMSEFVLRLCVAAQLEWPRPKPI